MEGKLCKPENVRSFKSKRCMEYVDNLIFIELHAL